MIFCKKVWKIFIPNQNLNCTQKGNRKVGLKRFLKKKSKMSPLPPLQKSQFLPLNLEIYLRTVKLPYLTENLILNNFDFHGWLSKSDIFWVMAVANSQISARVLGNLKKPWPDYSETVQIPQFEAAITRNISDLESQPLKSKLFKMPFSLR